MSDDGTGLPGPPSEGAPEPGSEPTERFDPASPTPDATVAQANRISRRTMIAALAALLVFGSCGVAYGVYRVTRSGDGGTAVGSPSPGPASAGPSASASATASPTSAAGIDLVVTDLTGRSVAVSNVGELAAGRFVVSVGGRAFIVEQGLLPGASIEFVFACKPGPLTANVDSTASVEETDETNNVLSAGPFECASPSVSPSATPTTSPTVSPTVDPELPDLVVRQVTSERVVVANIGEAAAGPFAISAGKAGTFTVNGLGAGQSHTVAYACTAGTISVTADANGQVVESNEGNNSRSGGPFTCLPDLVVTAIGVDSVTIANQGVGDAGPSTVGLNGQTFNVPPIAAGGKATIGYACFGGPVQAIADLFDDVVESNEGNNDLQVDVGPCP